MVWWILLAIYLIGYFILVFAGLYVRYEGQYITNFELFVMPLAWPIAAIYMLFTKTLRR